MCAILPIAALALTAAGTAGQIVAQKQQQSARTRTIGEALAKQQVNADKSLAAVNGRIAQSEKPVSQVADKTASRVESLKQAASTPLLLPKTANTNKVIESVKNSEASKARRFSMQQADARGRLEGLGSFLLQQNLANSRTAGDVGKYASFMRGDQALVPLALENANRKGEGLRTFGTIAQGLGQLGLMAGSAGYGWGKPTPVGSYTGDVITPANTSFMV